MSLIDSAYKIPKDMENQLKFWLLMDAWSIEDAAQIISGIDPDKTMQPSYTVNRTVGAVTLFTGRQLPSSPPGETYRLIHGKVFDSSELVEGETFDDIYYAEFEWCSKEWNALKAYFDNCAIIARLFNNPTTCPTSPKEWIERALSKNIAIPWLALAKEKGLLPNSMTEEFESPSKSNSATDISYVPSNVKHEAGKLKTQKMYQTWQKKYHELVKLHGHRNMSGEWYSQQIAKLEIAEGRNSNSILRIMKKKTRA